MRKGSFAWILAIALVACVALPVSAKKPAAEIVPPDGTYGGLTYDQLSVAWWQWAFGLEFPDHNPLADTKGKDAGNGQQGDIWFLCGIWWANNTTPEAGPVTRNILVPEGTALFFPIVNGENNVVETPGSTPEEMAAKMAADMNEFTNDNLYCTIDGKPVQNLTSYRATASDFSIFLQPENVLPTWGIEFPGGQIDDVVADGFFVLVKPLPMGEHTITFGVKNLNWSMDIVYKLKVVPQAAFKNR